MIINNINIIKNYIIFFLKIIIQHYFMGKKTKIKRESDKKNFSYLIERSIYKVIHIRRFSYLNVPTGM